MKTTVGYNPQKHAPAEVVAESVGTVALDAGETPTAEPSAEPDAAQKPGGLLGRLGIGKKAGADTPTDSVPTAETGSPEAPSEL